MSIFNLIKYLWGSVVTGESISNEIKERYQSKKNVEHYCVLDTLKHGTETDMNMKIEIQNAKIYFDNVRLCYTIDDMIRYSGTLWGVDFCELPKKTGRQLTDKYHVDRDNYYDIVVAIGDNPVHMGHIKARYKYNNLEIEIVYVHPDFQGRGLTEKLFLLLWCYIVGANYHKSIKAIYLTYAASVPVFQTYNRMINLLNFHNPILDRLNLEKNMFNKDFMYAIHIVLKEFSINFTSLYFDVLNSDNYHLSKLNTEKFMEKLIKFINILKDMRIESIDDACLFAELYSSENLLSIDRVVFWYGTVYSKYQRIFGTLINTYILKAQDYFKKYTIMK